MDNQILDELENRISAAIETINKLREENKRLREEKAGLVTQLDEQEKNIERLRQRCDELTENEHQSDQIVEKMRHIKDRIQSLITKMDELEPLP